MTTDPATVNRPEAEAGSAPAGRPSSPPAGANLIRNCATCGKPLLNRRSSAKFCNDKCRNQKRQVQRPFVALDGEGAKDEYVLLASSTGKWIGTKQGLSTEECLDFLLDLPRGSNSGIKPIYVWFAFDYDVNMILRDVPLKGENSVEQLKRTNEIFWRGYRITYIRRKILRIARGNRRHTSYDIWGFFQTSFEKSLSDWGLESTPLIEEGKASRSGFASWSLKRIRNYNDDELRLLAKLAEKLRESVGPLELPIQSWHGPAALAGAWLRKNKVKEWMNAEPLDSSFTDVTTRAYFGGRIDVLGYGIVDPVFHYDIVSAYPSAIANLPNLEKLTWKKRRGKGIPRGRLYAARVRWEIPTAYWAPFPWRSNNGSIRYPCKGHGWYWFHEIEAAIAKFGPDHFEILERWEAEGELEYPFYNLIHDTFKYRGELKRQNHPSHKAVKLILNSLYGKFAQTVGKAQYYSPIWAGLITSETRAKLLSVVTDDVVCVMTDSLWSQKQLDIPIGVGLGEWEQQDENRLILAEAGLYEASAPDGSKSVWQRGFDKRNPVDIEYLVNQWLTGDASYTPVYTVQRFIGMGLATVTSYPWRKWISINRKIEPVPLAGTTKRLPSLPTNTVLDPSFVRLQLRPADTDELSAPYSKLTMDNALVLQRLEEEVVEE